MKYSTRKDLNVAVNGLVREGWVFYRGGKHGRLRHPSGSPTLTVSRSPSDRRSLDNFLHDVRRASRIQLNMSR